MVSTGSGQNKSEIKTVQKEDKEAYLRVDNMPTFGNDGDLNSFRTYVMSNVRYPAEAMKRKITGKVVVSFTIDESGKLTDVKILQTPDQLLSQEVIRVVSQSPAWAPGKQDGKAVKVRLTIPVDFKLDGADKNTEASDYSQKPRNSIDEISVVGFSPR